MTYTVSDKPQLTVEVNDHLGACNYESMWKTGCTFLFEDPTPKVMSFYSEEPYTFVEIIGEALDFLSFNYIEWAGFPCFNPQISYESITC